ncbi:DUF1266 domain-containing protein [Streptomyces sp. AA1529]|uniref:DUF1266 domain-containing protein n=1 Tax=Streptomyces sp. AA1529 TaxID=1203257 RepID=UPI003D722624
MWKRGAAEEAAGATGVGSGAAGAGAAAPAWAEAPSVVEQRLYEAKCRHDWAGYLDVLAGQYLYRLASRPWLDANPGHLPARMQPVWRAEVQSWCAAVYTEAMLPAPIEDPVFISESLGDYARDWSAQDPQWLAVNPGSPCEAYFPASRSLCALWKQHADRVDHVCAHGTLRTLWLGGPRSGPVARGLACGALLSVNNGVYWNSLGHGNGYTDERRALDRWWGVTTREKWQQYQEELLTNEMSSPVWEFTLGLRHSLAQDFGGQVEPAHWRQAAERVLRKRIATATIELTPDGVTRTEGPSEEEVEWQIDGVKRLIGRITRYESRFRADGLLPEGRFVRSAAAWDYGRAANMARFGLASRFCTLPEAEDAVLRAGRVSAVGYRSWEDFSAGYILGRCLHFDEEEFGSWYEDMLTAHRVLTTDPESPWLTLPFRAGDGN